MGRRLPLSTLLSFALVGFTVEFDNEAEHRVPHRTTDHGGTKSAAWLVSLAMFLNCLQFIPAEGIAIRELERRARTRPNWDGMRRWGTLYFEPDPNDRRTRPPQWAWLARTTAKGRVVQQTMRALLPEIEQRWRERFGASAIRDLRRALVAVLRTLPSGLPDCMPILRYGLMCEGPKDRGDAPPESEIAELPLIVLVSRVLLAMALEFEQESPLSLAICADVVRVVEPEGTLFYKLPEMSGVSKAAVTMAMGVLQKRGYARLIPQKPQRLGRMVLLTPEGTQVQTEASQQVRVLEERWNARVGAEAIAGLRSALEGLAGDGTPSGSPLFEGLTPYPDGWRAKVPAPTTLPHFPMVLHRGGFPDGR